MDLTSVKEGERCKVLKIEGGYGVIKKLERMGIRPDVEILKLSSQFAKGPVVIQVGNTQVAIGFGMAKKIIVEKID